MKKFKSIKKVILLSIITSIVTICSTPTLAKTQEYQINNVLQNFNKRKPDQQLPQEAIDSYNKISVINAENDSLTNDLALGCEFIDNNTYKLNIRVDFQGGELQEIIDATNDVQRNSVLKNLDRVKFVLNKGDTKIEKEATKTIEENVAHFNINLNRNEIEFGKSYILEINDVNTNKLIGYMNIEIPDKTNNKLDELSEDLKIPEDFQEKLREVLKTQNGSQNLNEFFKNLEKKYPNIKNFSAIVDAK